MWTDSERTPDRGRQRLAEAVASGQGGAVGMGAFPLGRVNKKGGLETGAG